jgi:hypothetical protein
MIKFFEILRTEEFKAVLERLPVGANEECYARSRLFPMGNLANLSESQRDPILRAMNAELNLYDDEFPTGTVISVRAREYNLHSGETIYDPVPGLGKIF